MAATQGTITKSFVLIILLVLVSTVLGLDYNLSNFNRSSFSLDFVFGAASSAYQYGGAAFEGGRGPSIWDTFTHKFPGKILDGSNGDVADDFYHMYKDDVKLMKDIGLDAFRLSISWSRILPSIGDQNNGTVQNGIEDPQRIDFYNRHLQAVEEAIKEGVNVKGLFAWSFLDNFEWGSGYTLRFGLCYVDYKNELKRIPKRSAIWLKNSLVE